MVVFLFDVDNTLIDNDRIEEYLRQRPAGSGKPSVSDIHITCLGDLLNYSLPDFLKYN